MLAKVLSAVLFYYEEIEHSMFVLKTSRITINRCPQANFGIFRAKSRKRCNVRSIN